MSSSRAFSARERDLLALVGLPHARAAPVEQHGLQQALGLNALRILLGDLAALALLARHLVDEPRAQHDEVGIGPAADAERDALVAMHAVTDPGAVERLGLLRPRLRQAQVAATSVSWLSTPML